MGSGEVTVYESAIVDGEKLRKATANEPRRIPGGPTGNQSIAPLQECVENHQKSKKPMQMVNKVHGMEIATCEHWKHMSIRYFMQGTRPATK